MVLCWSAKWLHSFRTKLRHTYSLWTIDNFMRHYKKLATILRLKIIINGLSHDPLETGGDEDPTALFSELAAHPSENAAPIVTYDPCWGHRNVTRKGNDQDWWSKSTPHLLFTSSAAVYFTLTTGRAGNLSITRAWCHLTAWPRKFYSDNFDISHLDIKTQYEVNNVVDLIVYDLGIYASSARQKEPRL